MEQLILLLGAGPLTIDEVQAGKYRTAKYFLKDDPEPDLETPFVGEAIVGLHEGRFDAVHIFGTAGSIWDVLLRHAGDSLKDETYEELLTLADQDAPERFPGSLRERIQYRVGEQLGTRVEPHLLPIGRTQEEYWEMLRRLAELDIREGTVSIDVTHALRSQSVFLFIALIYLRAVHDQLSLGSVFYGANAIAQEHFDGRTPIFDLRPMAQMLDWIDAAQAFDRHGDAAPLSRLLDQEGGEAMGEVAKRARYVSQVLQLNTLSKIEANTRKWVRQLEELSEEAPLPLRLIRPKLLEGASKIQQQPKWKAMLTVARQHWSSYRAGLAVLAAWEAVIERFAALYGHTGARDMETYKALWRVASDTDLRWYKQKGLGHLPQLVSRLHTYRNGIAHSRQSGHESFQPQDVYREFPDQLSYLEEHLGDPALESVPQEALLYDYN